MKWIWAYILCFTSAVHNLHATCINYFGHQRFAPLHAEEKKIMDECVRVCRRNARIFFKVMVFACTCWSAFPLLEDGRRLPVNMWVPYKSPGKVTFFLTYFYACAMTVYMAFVSEQMGPLIGSLAYFATSHMKILKYNLRNLASINNDHDVSVVEFENVCAPLNQCIKHHNDILYFVKIYEKCFSFCVFIQIACHIFTLCFSSIGLTMVSLTSAHGVLYVLIYSVLACEVFFYCHYGSLLFEENEGLRNEICAGSWYKYDVKIRKMLIIIMERAKVPLILSVGKVMDLTYGTFTSVLKTSYSLIAVMKQYA